MRLSKWNWLLLAAIVAAPASAGSEFGDYNGLPKDLAAAATAYDMAQASADQAELQRLLADDYVFAGANGKNETKSQTIADFLVPGDKTVEVVISEQVRRVWPTGAVLGGMVNAKKLSHGKPYTMRARFVDVWAKRKGHWQVVFTQMDNAP